VKVKVKVNAGMQSLLTNEYRLKTTRRCCLHQKTKVLCGATENFVYCFQGIGLGCLGLGGFKFDLLQCHLGVSYSRCGIVSA
jgi:hypothetical protein